MNTILPTKLTSTPPAMFNAASKPNPPLPAATPAWSASHCHPVFFTDKLRKQPALLSSASAAQGSPVAHGYAYQDAQRINGVAGSRL